MRFYKKSHELNIEIWFLRLKYDSNLNVAILKQNIWEVYGSKFNKLEKDSLKLENEKNDNVKAYIAFLKICSVCCIAKSVNTIRQRVPRGYTIFLPLKS